MHKNRHTISKLYKHDTEYANREFFDAIARLRNAKRPLINAAFKFSDAAK